ncbi:uncharacterized protein Dana_GF22259 [Drosophila ananassae]|uniref:Uncharacterized protein n=2 Tax=Drosophila ananassae TaxID=7217 RepID=B3MZ42_DROAN|nr:uncharacterized protein Dana_GF22259 [Drosophila ananassae]KAH8313933.1 hypothetical protein KR067_003695 [Drosophila pandora]
MLREHGWGVVLCVVVLVATVLQLCRGNYYRDRRKHCLDMHADGQTNCSKCAELYIFIKNPAIRRCEHVNGRCFPYRTVFPSAKSCEQTCQPYIVRATVHLVTTPRPIEALRLDYNDESSGEGEVKQ